MLGSVRKRDDDRLDYDVDFTKWLSDDDSITGATATSSSTDLLVDSVQVFGEIVKVWLSEGLVDASYTINVIASTAKGRIKEVSFNLRVVEC